MAQHDPPSGRPRRTLRRHRVAIGAVLCAVALSGGLVACGGDDDDSRQAAAPAAFPAGTPTEVTDAASAFPAPNADYHNTRAVGGRINASNIATLEKAWSVPLTGESTFGVFSANPIVTSDTVYLQDIGSNVTAVDRATGEVKWTHKFDKPTTGPNGVAIGGGMVVGGTATSVFALKADTGELVWEKKVIRQPSEGVDMAPLIWNDTVIISTVPGASLANFYGGGGKGIVHAFDLATGEQKWEFDTTTDNLWGNPKVNTGGGLWQTPSVDENGDVYMAVANPGPWSGTKEYPNGTSRPGDNLYTNSLVVLDGKTGKIKWHWQALSHDLRDWDLHLGPILTDFTIDGKDTPVVVLSGKLGTVFVVNRDTHKLIWKKDVGKHTPEAGAADGKGTADNDGPDRNAPFTKFPVTVYPGWLGGVETAMAVSDGVIYVPVNNLCSVYTANANFTEGSELCDFSTSSGELVALDGATGEQLWKKDFDTQNYGGATVVNDAVVTVTFDGKIHAFDKTKGTELWTEQLPAQSNSTPAIADDMLVAGAGFASAKGMTPEVVAYKLPG
ncbi:MAG TPA: PQQ-binding-like beta-propeller repeat protein [Miltoncostaea sp.]|nr:PQQ-binding-like beta-propeller repeat protein [Miltoncostaea sp.]